MKDPKEIYEDIYSVEHFYGIDAPSYTESMPRWLKECANIERRRVCQLYYDWLYETFPRSNKKPKIVADLGCGDAVDTIALFDPTVGILSQADEIRNERPFTDHLRFDFYDFSDNALAAIEYQDPDGVNVAYPEWIGLMSRYDFNIAPWTLQRQADLIISVGLSPHMHSHIMFFASCGVNARKSIITFNRNDTREGLLLASDDFVEKGLVYNLTNKEQLEADLDQYKKTIEMFSAVFSSAEINLRYKIHETPISLILEMEMTHKD